MLDPLTSALTALLVLIGVAYTALSGRRNAGDQNTTTLTVNARNAAIEADKVQLTDRQYQAQREQMAVDIIEQFGANYSRLLKDANDAIDRLTARVVLLETHVRECETALALKALRIERIEVHAREMGWELP